MPSPTSTDLARWRDLIVQARLQAARPRRDPRELRRVARACRKTVLPFGGSSVGDSLFGVLSARALALSELPPSSRAAHAAELLQAATRCAELLGAPAPPADAGASPPARRYRADIDG